ncbi:methylated-DNA--protein-cysteine methyltransferase [Strix aluco]|uniref:methylated-DNA--protein-cysteine methyltransferase n=1 Tax=Strix aluco TaxID=111821 RepID=UPI003DA5CBD0
MRPGLLGPLPSAGAGFRGRPGSSAPAAAPPSRTGTAPAGDAPAASQPLSLLLLAGRHCAAFWLICPSRPLTSPRSRGPQCFTVWGIYQQGATNCGAGGDISSTMASRLVPNVNSKQEESQCKEKHAVLLSPVGKLQISGCEMGLHEIKLPKMSVLPSGSGESSAMCEVCEGAEEMTEPLKQCTAWLRAYFYEPARTTSLPVPAFHHPLLLRDSFTKQVLWTLLRDVKFGEAVSYKQLADLSGNSRAARAVGGAMRSNPIPIIIPCHRVICSSGQMGNYGGGNLMKEWLLSHEKLQKEKLAY